MAETSSLLNCRTDLPVPGVRIPLSPPKAQKKAAEFTHVAFFCASLAKVFMFAIAARLFLFPTVTYHALAFDLSRNRPETLPVATRYPRPVTKSRQNVTGRNKIPSTCHEIAAKRYWSQQNTFDLSRNRRKTLQVARCRNESERDFKSAAMKSNTAT